MNTKPIRPCRECAAPLVIGSNWTVGREKARDYTCRPCVAEQRRGYRKKNAAAISEQKRVYYQANTTTIAEQQRDYRAQNADAIREYRAQNAAAIAEQGRKWREANPGVQRAIKATRRARKRSSATPTTPQERREVHAIYTDARLAEQFTGTTFHVDHRQPIALGGSSLADNLQHLPTRMNLAKHDMSHAAALERVDGYREWTEGPPTFET